MPGSVSLLSVPEIATFMSATIIGGAILQWPLGRLSDRIDRRWVIIIAGLGGAATGVALVLFSGVSNNALLALSCLYGGFAFPLYALAIAHTNDSAGPEDFVDIASGLLLFFSIGAIVGPIAASAVIDVFGHVMLFAYTAVVHVLTAAFAYYRMRRRASQPPDERGNFVAVHKMSPGIAEIDPRAKDDGPGVPE